MVKKAAIVCSGKELTYGIHLLSLFHHEEEDKLLSSKKNVFLQPELYSAGTFTRIKLPTDVLQIFIGNTGIPVPAGKTVFQQYGMQLIQSGTFYLLLADDRGLDGSTYEAFIRFANEKREQYLLSEQDYINQLQTLGKLSCIPEFSPIRPGGLFRRKSEYIQQQYDCLALVLYLDFLIEKTE